MKITLNNPLDMHIHFRDEEMLKVVAPLTSKNFSWALVMPNLVPPVMTRKDVELYLERIKKEVWKDDFTPYMTVFFNEWLTYEVLKDLKDVILSVKLYPAGVTTNSESWIKAIDIEKHGFIFEAMSDLWIPLNIHWETADFVMDREKNFIPTYEMLAQAFPKLKIIMEHITTSHAVEVLEKYENLYATITLQHLIITLDDVAGGMLNPHLFCKPIAKTPKDRDALLKVAISWHPKVMFGSDSAPHSKDKKETCLCAAGVFTSPIALQCLTQLFEENNSLDSLQVFISDNAVKIYNLKPVSKNITLEKKDFIVPSNYWEVIPFKANETISWSII